MLLCQLWSPARFANDMTAEQMCRSYFNIDTSNLDTNSGQPHVPWRSYRLLVLADFTRRPVLRKLSTSAKGGYLLLGCSLLLQTPSMGSLQIVVYLHPRTLFWSPMVSNSRQACCTSRPEITVNPKRSTKRALICRWSQRSLWPMWLSFFNLT